MKFLAIAFLVAVVISGLKLNDRIQVEITHLIKSTGSESRKCYTIFEFYATKISTVLVGLFSTDINPQAIAEFKDLSLRVLNAIGIQFKDTSQTAEGL